MKFSSPVHAPEGQSSGLTSYARVNRVRPVQTLINILEALLSLMGVVIVILAVRYGSFEKAGLTIDQTVHCVHMGIDKLISQAHK